MSFERNILKIHAEIEIGTIFKSLTAVILEL